MSDNIFILSRGFNGLNAHRAATEEETKKARTSFEVEVKKSFSRNTSDLIAGNNVNISKSKNITMYQVKVINAWRLLCFLLVQFVIEAI